ncbi:MAG: acetyl-CoA carboxylase carboxyl transferase subunit alpha/beta [Deltaproteobacteria bacterium]|nr:acetyl-CoA carboxylase carboxyl transferase subunit alpha/beta [Deltaproteobacteria bacterium]MBW2081818.1 acetyl-CoA carboxylase carboxyl transferase subunit alpha/beta [Deltaproteobacteria bacterium]HDM09172.1 acetyl-CoA carboxylase carboxyl transferase subunit alpha/beta [Desulfobacteraceae bacterium]
MTKVDLVEIFKKRTRHPYRPRASDIIEKLFPEFDYFDTPSGSLVAGVANFMEKDLYVIAQQKPKPEDFKTKGDLAVLNRGMLTSDDHSFILSMLKKARAMNQDSTYIFSIIDTYGADISMYSAQRFQAFFISHLIREFLTIPLRTISLILGEGGSGGALAIQVTDIRAQMEDALYATAPPESMASIIFRDPSRIDDALSILKPTARELRALGVIDRVVSSPEDVTDCQGMAENVKNFLNRAIKDLSRSRIKRLIKKRETRAKQYGIYKKSGPLHDLKRYIEKPWKKAFRKPPPDIKIVDHSSLTEVADHYGDIRPEEEGVEYVECGMTSGGKRRGGCGKLIPLKRFLENHNVCPECGFSYTLDASGWIDCLTDPGSFHELHRNLTVFQLLDEDSITDYYRDFLARQEGRSQFKESLVVGSARIHHFRVVIAVSEFYFCGGSMGVVFGEKFRRAVDYAIQENLPFVSLCCSGGARLYEGISALMQMVKTTESVNRLKRHGLPYISILADPATGGAIASYAALGDIVIAEPNALVIFAGPRVMAARGFEVDEELVRSDSLYQISKDIYRSLNYYHRIRGIQEVCERKDMKYTVAKYLDFCTKMGYGPKKKKRKSGKKLVTF